MSNAGTATMIEDRSFGPQAITSRQAMTALIGQGIVLTTAGLALWYFSGRSIGDFVTFSAEDAALGTGLAACLIALAAIPFSLFPRMAEALVRLQAKSYRFLGPRLGWPALVLISLIAGISEEAAFRAGLQTWLTDLIGPVGAIAVASALFAAIHLARPLISVLIFVIGALFGIVYWYTGSLLLVALAHALYDIWALRYLNREMERLRLFDTPPSPADAAPLAKSPDGG